MADKKPAATRSRRAAGKREGPAAPEGKVEAAARRIDRGSKELADWRGGGLQRVRAIIKAAEPEVVEEWRWATPVWSHDGLVCTGEAHKNVVKMTFARG